MSWGTSFQAGIYVSRRVYKSKSEVNEAIDEANKSIHGTIGMLKMYAARTPKDIDDLTSISAEIETITDELSDLYVLRYQLQLLLECIDDDPELLTKIYEG